jgi:hypothetical protein
MNGLFTQGTPSHNNKIVFSVIFGFMLGILYFKLFSNYNCVYLDITNKK